MGLKDDSIVKPHLHTEIYNGYIGVVEFVQLICFSEIKFFKPCQHEKLWTYHNTLWGYVMKAFKTSPDVIYIAVLNNTASLFHILKSIFSFSFSWSLK